MTSQSLYFDVSELGTLVFAPASLVEEIVRIRSVLPTWRTWGDAQADVSPARFRELVDLLTAPAQPPELDSPLAVEELADPEPWPRLSYEAIADWVPDEVIDTYGQPFDTMMSSGVHLPAELEDEILAALDRHGLSCTRRDDLADLFSDEV